MTSSTHHQAGSPAPAPDAETHAGAQHFCAIAEGDAAVGASPRVLVAGCGTGHEAGYIHRRLGGTLIGFDLEPGWDPTIVDPQRGLDLRVGSILELPLADGSVDTIFYHHVIEHVDDPAGSLRELARVLRRDGLLYVGTPNRHRAVGYLGSFEATWSEKLRWNAADWKARLSGRFHNDRGAHAGFSETELRGLLAADFRDVTFRTADYLRFKYGSRVPARALAVLDTRVGREVLAPSVYAVARR